MKCVALSINDLLRISRMLDRIALGVLRKVVTSEPRDTLAHARRRPQAWRKRSAL
jgi:hypothetical protein